MFILFKFTCTVYKSYWGSVVGRQVEVSATKWSLVHRSPTACGASLCVI